MGAWGIGHFENDDAGDWVFELEDTKSLDPVKSAFAAVDESGDYLESPDASAALAAAEIIAAIRGNPASDLPESVASIIDDLGAAVHGDLAAKAISVVEKVKSGSELRELWEETDDFAEWLSKVDDLLQRLQ